MNKAKRVKDKPERTMTEGEALTLADCIADRLEDLNDDILTDFILLLRWYAYKDEGKRLDSPAENIYVQTEHRYAASIAGVAEAICEAMMTGCGRGRKGKEEASREH